jgi:hypothetical protein
MPNHEDLSPVQWDDHPGHSLLRRYDATDWSSRHQAFQSVDWVDNAHKKGMYQRERYPQRAAADSGVIGRQFQELLESWRDETAGLSSTTRIVMNDAYQKIIGLGEPAVPLLLRELANGADHLGWALRAITREDPVPRDAAGDVERIAQIWLEWGRENDKI